MSDALIIDAGGASPIVVVCQRIGKGALRKVGSVTPSFNGANRSSERGQARTIPVTTSYLDTATEASIQAAIMNGRQMICSGDILGNIPTLCSIECASSDIVPGTSPELFVMQLTISEVNASVTLLRYAPGDTITGESFSRSTTGTYHDVNGVVQSAAINTKRDAHYINGVRTVLLEGAGASIPLDSENWPSANWAVSGTGAKTTGQADPKGETTGALLDSGASAGGNIHHTAAFTGDGTKSVAIYLKKGTASATDVSIFDGTTSTERHRIRATWDISGVPTLTTIAGSGTRYTPTALGTTGWYRISFTVASVVAANANLLIIYPGTNAGTGTVSAAFPQGENSTFPTSYMVSTGSAGSRGADLYSLPFTPPPGEISIYLKFIERGSISLNVKVFEISNAAGDFPHFFVNSQTALYNAHHSNGVSSVDSQLAAAPAIGDTEELLARLFANGSIDLTQSVNGAASASAAQSAALSLATAWSDDVLWLNSGGSAGAAGFMALQSFKVLAGARSLTEMRAA